MEIKNEVKHKITSALPDEAFDVFIDPNNNSDIVWEEAGKEFFYKGEMYDVAKIKNGNRYYCLNDKQEKKLMSDYKKAHSNRGQQKSQKINLGFLQGFVLPNDTKDFNQRSILIERNYYSRSVSLITASKQISTPPPKVLG